LCPGVCVGEITSAQYKKIIRRLMRFFEGGRDAVSGEMKREMTRAAADERFEDAADLRNRLFALEHVRDESILKHEDSRNAEFINIFGRVEGYDISNTSGKDAVGSMVVMVDGEPKKSEYRIFGIKDVDGPNDVAMMRETLMRRFARTVKPEDGKSWPLPDLVLIDGGAPQMGVAKAVLEHYGLKIPLVGIAKGPDRKQDELVYDKNDYELARLVRAFKPLLQRCRDEAHRFAVSWHRKKRAKSFLA
jgi:excinuclease ABC subunit C